MLALPMEKGKSLSALQDGVEAFGVLDRVKVSLFFGSIESKAYLGILKSLGIGGYYDEQIALASGNVDYGKGHFTCFQFPYDWRRSCAENAAALGEFIKEKKAYVEGEYRERFGISNPDVKFDLVAHSMGGLVTRYFLRYGDQPLPKSGLPKLNWAGTKDVSKVILVGTPNAGSIKALQNSLYGLKLGPTRRLSFSPGVVGTMPAGYELLPRARHGVLRNDSTGELMDPLDVEHWDENGWGLLDPDEAPILESLLPHVADPQERRDIARDHLVKCLDNARRFHAALDRPAKLPKGKELVLFAGDAEQTNALAKFYPEDDMVYVTDKLPGDGVVPRYSALMDERTGGDSPHSFLKTPIDWSNTTFLFSDHLGLTTSPVFVDNMLHILLEQP